MAAIRTTRPLSRTGRTHIDGDRVQFLGAVEREARNQLLSEALGARSHDHAAGAFGMTLIEAMACGTRCWARAMGSLPEIVVDGVDRLLMRYGGRCGRTRAALAALDRRACRTRVEREFSIERMVDRILPRTGGARLRLPPPPSEHLEEIRRHDWWDRPMAYTEIPPNQRT